MMKIDPNIQSQTVPESQSFNVLWKFFRSRHLGVADQDWNNRELALQGVTDFEPHKIIGFVNTPTLVFALAYPIRSNNRHQNLRATDYLFDVIAKIDAVRDRIEIHENIAATELCLKSVVQAAGNGQ